MDNYKWCNDRLVTTSLTKACRIINDCIKTRLRISCSLLDLILMEIRKIFKSEQPYLVSLYSALYIIAYYGMMCIGELTQSQHVLCARNVHLAKNKDKLLMILYTSKTHGLGSKPQKIKITAHDKREHTKEKVVHRHFWPFILVRDYLQKRGGYNTESEQLFIFSDGSPVKPQNAAMILKTALTNMGLNNNLYSFHSFRIGRTSDLIKMGYPLEVVKRLGRWKFNAVYKYIRS